MKIKHTFILLLLAVGTLSAQTKEFDQLLKNNVSSTGVVNYKNIISNISTLDNYLAYLEKTTPQSSWSANKAKAFWMNAYNAYTIKLITDNYPTKSIMNIKKNGKNAWDIPFAKVGGKTYTLNQIEHDILRAKYPDPRIHVGVNCASYSCPPLANYAFTESNVDSSLEKLMKNFVNDPNRNMITEKKLKLSKIFEWYKGDFIKQGSLVEYISKYSNSPVDKKAKVQYLEYIWSLNE